MNVDIVRAAGDHAGNKSSGIIGVPFNDRLANILDFNIVAADTQPDSRGIGYRLRTGPGRIGVVVREHTGRGVKDIPTVNHDVMNAAGDADSLSIAAITRTEQDRIVVQLNKQVIRTQS